MNQKSASDRFGHLQTQRDLAWSEILENSKWANFIREGEFDRRLYGIYLIETYHYVIHNPRHQAMVGAGTKEPIFKYIKFCYEHAEEETGHEMMAFHDLLSLGYKKGSFELPQALSQTEVLIGYLYWISTNGNSLQRLGYSFWAEDSYQYIGDILKILSDTLNLEPKNMSFLVSHATIDEKHSQEIEEMICEFCKTDDDWESVEKVMKTSLRLQSEMLDAVIAEYLNLSSGSRSRYQFLSNVNEYAENIL